MPNGLSEARLAAAEASGGGSNDIIHDALLRRLVDLQAKGEVLDFGAGRGDLTTKLAAAGRFSSVAGVDIMLRSPALPGDVRWHAQDLNEPLRLADRSADVIVAAEVIEHLENARALAREWFRLLRPGGLLVLSTPNNESARSLLHLVLRGHYVAFADSCYPAHITALLRKDMQRILVEAGFSQPLFAYTNHGGVPGMPRVTWQAVSRGLLKGRWWSDNVIATARRPIQG